jgi:amphi-Trp domain-containing protein
MPEDVLFEVESHQTRADIAATLRNVADKLESGGEITLNAGDQSITLDPASNPEFEIKVEREYARGASSGDLSIEFEIEWAEDGSDDGGDGSVSIE